MNYFCKGKQEVDILQKKGLGWEGAWLGFIIVTTTIIIVVMKNKQFVLFRFNTTRGCRHREGKTTSVSRKDQARS